MERNQANRARTSLLMVVPLSLIACSPGLGPSGAPEDLELPGEEGHAVQALAGPEDAWWVTEYNDMSSTEDDGKCQTAYTNCGPASIAMIRNKVTSSTPKHGAGWMRQEMFNYGWDTGDCSTGTNAAERTGLLKERLSTGKWIDKTTYYTVTNYCKSTSTYTSTDLKNDMATGAVAAAEASGRYTGTGGQMGPCGWAQTSGHSLAVVGWDGTTFTVLDPDSHKKQSGAFARCGSSKTWTTDKNGKKVQTAYFKAQWTPTQLTRWSSGFGGTKGSNLCVTTIAGPTCTAESNTAFCSRLGKSCGTVTAPDNCGKSRSANCGTCTAPKTCSTTNVCRCAAESDPAFCTRLGGCGTVSGTDLCGLARSIDCGTCGIAAKGSLSIGVTVPLACAEVEFASEDDGASIVLAPCQGVDQQLWSLTDFGQLQSASSAKCTLVQGSAPALIVQAACAAAVSDPQAWTFPSVQVVNASLRCLQHGAEGDALTIETCQEGDANQQFTYRADTRQLMSRSGSCVEAQDGAASGSAVKLAACAPDLPSQRWLTERGGLVSGVDPLQCLWVAGGKVDAPGTLTEIQPCSDAEEQRWGLRGEVRDHASTSCLERPAAVEEQLRLAACGGTARQTWTLWSPASDPAPVETDAGVEAEDAGVDTDASSGSVDGGGTDASSGSVAPTGHGCGCSAGRDTPGLAVLVVGLLVLGLPVASRRRRARPAR